MKNIKPQSLKKNFILQGLHEVLILVIPLIISPYLTRKLGDTSLGIYTYTNSIVGYFLIFAMLGISNYGQRVIASRRNDYEKLRKTFWSLYTVHLIVSFIAVCFYFIFVFCFQSQYKKIYIIQIIYLFSAIFDITWLFQGLENFKSVVIRNAVTRTLECICIFMFVKEPSDLFKYTLIMSISMIFSQIIMIPQAIRYIKPIKINISDMKEHIMPLFILFLAVIASQLYTMFDKTLIGTLSTKENVAYYEYSNKIVQVPISVLGTISTVMLPKACSFMVHNDTESSNKYMRYSLEVVCFVGIGAIFGLLSISELLALLYYGEKFLICGKIILTLTPLIFIIPVGRILRAQYIVPKSMDKWLVISYVINSIVNLILTILLIPKFGIYGAVIGTIVAEMVCFIYQLIVCKDFMKIIDIVKTSIPYLIIGIIMFFALFFIKKLMNDSWFDLIIQLVIGGVIYFVLSSIYLLHFSTIKNDVKQLIFYKKH